MGTLYAAQFDLVQMFFLALIFFFSAFVAYLNYRSEMYLIKHRIYKSYYRKTGDIRFGFMLIAIGVATGVSLLFTGQFNTPANLGFFIPAFSGLILIITSFLEIEDDYTGLKKK